MTTPLELLASFVPRMIVERFSEDATPPGQAASREFPAAVFFADVAGFTSLTERIGREGPAGVEKLTNLLNDYFGRTIDLVDAHGGDVIKFAGDAITAIWKAKLTSHGLHEATLRAANCGLAIQEALQSFEADGSRLSQRITIGCGDVRALELGGVFDRWEWLVGGSPVEEITELNQRTTVGRVSLSAKAWSLVGQDCRGSVLPGGQVLLKKIVRPLTPQKDADPPLRAAMERGLRAFIPGAVLSRMSAGHSDWLGELRQVSILFVNLPTLNHNTPLEVVQTAMRMLQAATYNYEGSINKLSSDDKGTTLVSAFGLPPLTHKDDPARAVQTALEMRAGLDELCLDASLGVATGRVFCGLVGNAIRREYTVMGDQVNLTARLMQAAKGDILCDRVTFQRAAGSCDFETLPPIRVKGKQHALDVFRPLCVSQVSTTASPLIGRRDEMAMLRDALESLPGVERNVVTTICGAADIGKSRLLEEVAAIARSTGMRVFSGGGDAREETSSYYAWRSVFNQLFQFEQLPDDANSHRQAVLEFLAANAMPRSQIGLLNSVLPLDFPESETVRRMEGKVRAANTRELLVSLLERAASKQPLLLLLDDAQWFDSGSWAVTGLVARRVPNLVFVLAMRPLDEPTPVEYQQLLARPDLRQLHLDRLQQEEVDRLVREDLGVAELPGLVASFINERVQGQPFFAQQLAFALRDTNLIRCEGGRCELNCEPEELERLDFPNALTGVITSRLDRLVPQQQMTAKAASVIGREFPFLLLREIYPIEADQHQLPDYLNALECKQIVQPAEAGSSPTYEFTYGMIQQVAYNLMLFQQRRQLHQAVALYFESQPGETPPAMFPPLAYHWDRAGDQSKSLEYRERAADNALRIGSYKEATVFLEQMLTRLRSSPASLPDLRQSVLERKLGEAFLGMGQLLDSLGRFHRALELVGHPAPTNGIATLLSILVQAARQVCHRVGPKKSNQPKASAALFEQFRNYEHLAEVHYFANNTFGFLHAVLRSLNLAERLNAPAELARAYANMGVTVGTMNLHSTAERYLRRAQETAASVDHLPTQSWVYLVTGVYCNGVGFWHRSREALDKSLGIAKELGDDRQVGVLLTLRGATYYYQGDFDTAVEHWSQVGRLGQRRNDALQEAWGYGGLAMNYLRLGQLSLAIENAQAAAELFLSNADTVSEIATSGVLAVACLRDGQLQRADELAMQVLQQLRELRRPNSYYLFEAYSAIAEVFLSPGHGTDRQTPDSGRKIGRKARLANRMMSNYARVFPIGRARCLVWQGKQHWLMGRPRKAMKSWRKCLETSQALGMHYDLALGHLELGRCDLTPREDRRAHLREAIKIFTQCNAQFDRKLAESCLDQGSSMT